MRKHITTTHRTLEKRKLEKNKIYTSDDLSNKVGLYDRSHQKCDIDFLNTSLSHIL